MSSIKRMLLAAMAVVGMLAFASTANATSPNPYSTSSGSGTLTTNTIFGDSSCSLSDVAGSIRDGSGSISSFTTTGCEGLLTGITGFLGITITVDLSRSPPVVRVIISGITITNALGGTCLYTGTLTGTGTPGTGNASVTGNVTLNSARSRGICNSPAAVRLDVSLPGLTF